MYTSAKARVAKCKCARFCTYLLLDEINNDDYGVNRVQIMANLSCTDEYHCYKGFLIVLSVYHCLSGSQLARQNLTQE